MKDYWDLPDDFDDPNAKYALNIGEGIGREVGNRVAAQEKVASNQVRLTMDWNVPTAVRRVTKNCSWKGKGQWRLAPVSLTLGEQPAGTR
jgi:hypothetical protein